MKKNMRSHTNDGLKGTLDLLVTRKRFVTPITAQFLKQLRWERHVPVASTLALADVITIRLLSISSILICDASVLG
jgi:hypothetical protein